jgi:hypothetical protein
MLSNRSEVQAELVGSIIEGYSFDELIDYAKWKIFNGDLSTMDVMDEWQLTDMVANDMFDYYTEESDEDLIEEIITYFPEILDSIPDGDWEY